MSIVALGYGLLTAQQYPGDRRSPGMLMRECVDLAVEAERIGFDSVWTSEHHFFDDGYLSAQFPLLGAIAARTSRVMIGPCVLLLPLFDPVRVAEDAATVDLLADGRLVLGAGLGWREEELAGFDVRQAERVGRLVESLKIVRASLDGQAVPSGAAEGMFVTPVSGRHVPIWLAAMADAPARRAGRIADGLIATKVDPAGFARLAEFARAGMAEAAREAEPFTFAVHHPVFAWLGDDAWRRVEPYYHYFDWKYDDMTPSFRRRPGSAPPPPIDSARRAYLRSSCLCGTPEQVAEGISQYAAAASGDVHFIARCYYPGMDPGVQREAMRVFAEEVVPLLRTEPSRNQREEAIR